MYQYILNKKDFIILLATTLTFRIIYYYYNVINIFPDSITYLNFNKNIFKGEIDLNRTPLYPFFLKLVGFFSTNDLYLFNVVFFQSAISYISILYFYKLSLNIYKSRKTAIISSVIYGISPSLISWDCSIMTESLSISFTVIFLYYLLMYFKNKNIYLSILLTFMCLMMVMLRPAFLILFIILILVWVFMFFSYFKFWKQFLTNIVCCFFGILFLFQYCKLNEFQNGYFGISNVIDINQLPIIIKYQIYNNSNDKEIVNKIDSNIIKDSINSEFYSYTSSKIFSAFSWNRIHIFISKSIFNNKLKFIKYSFIKFYTIGHIKLAICYTTAKGFNYKILKSIQHFNFFTFFNLYILIFVDLLINLYMWVKYNIKLLFYIVLDFILIFQIVTIIIGTPSEYARILVPFLPILIILIFKYVDIFNFKQFIKYLIKLKP
jgi:hypothetical protein